MIADFILKTLTPEISPMVYIMMFISVFIGFCFMTGIWVDATESILYETGVLISKQVWGTFLFFTALLAEVGFATNKDWLIKLGGTTGFMAWLFACIELFALQHWYVLITVALFHLMFHGYVVLATSLGLIRRAPVDIRHYLD